MHRGSPAYNAGTAKGRAKSERLRKAKAHFGPQPPTLTRDPRSHTEGVANGGRVAGERPCAGIVTQIGLPSRLPSL